MTGVSILGSTGSIGRQAQNVIQDLGTQFRVLGIAAGRNKELALEQVKILKPEIVSLAREEDAEWLKKKLGDRSIDVVWGMEGLIEVATRPGVEIVLTAVSGAVGLIPTVRALQAGKDIALANKETLVAAGALVTKLAKEKNKHIFPVDSEHSAIWQCLNGEDRDTVSKIILTASGGPFRTWNREQMEKVTPEKALKHPNWNMGGKITVDSATLMNKGLEVIEARWLFDIDFDNIEIVIHPQSIIHSMVEFVDGSVIAQMGVPDMRLPIQYALTYPRRVKGSAPGLSWPVCDLSFEAPDFDRFPCLRLAYDAAKIGGTMPAVLNAANEVAVNSFLSGLVSFTAIPVVVERVMGKHDLIEFPSLEDILEADQWAREKARSFIGAGNDLAPAVDER